MNANFQQENRVLRHANINDLPQIVAIYNSTVAGRMVTADTEEVSVESRTSWFKQHQESSRPLYVLEENNRIIAWLSFHSFYGRPAYSITCEIAIYIHQDFRGQQLGSYLLETAIQRSPELNIENLLGYIFAHNEPSLKLFRKYGFETWGTFPQVGIIDHQYVDLLILGKKIK